LRLRSFWREWFEEKKKISWILDATLGMGMSHFV
jgi:hypothetical protein